MRSRLFLKIYLTLLASLAAVALASAAFVWLGQGEEESSWQSQRARFVAALIPPDMDLQSIKATLERFSRAFDADIAVYDPRGRLIASAGQPLPPDVREGRWRHARGSFHTMVTELPDGRVVAARMARPFRPSARNPLTYLALIAGVIGLAAYPVVRHLTSRLERLRRGVDAWGRGDFVARVPADGSDEVAAVAKSFNTAADHVERLITSNRALLANASHELRSPLARLRMAIDLYEQAPDENRKEEIVRNLAELDTLVEEILLASRLDHVQKLDAPESIDLLALVSEEGARHGVEVFGTPAAVMGDARLLGRLVRNLMQNALRHGVPPVTASVAQVDSTVELEIRDEGPGIPDSENVRVFEPFYRPSGRSEVTGGWGLGLALVRQIAERHGGAVRYESPSGGGACFVVTLPAHRAAPTIG
ncbi:HAMP domain-containing histidine kinase [Rhizobium sp. SEMIA 4085]|uniref:histidine kinase n=1 Tax=Rhizobium gallicum bv. gallicum R602sp TaxID=1041138 RepID=A0A0B4XF51_9HYPH|nr:MULTISPECIES: HAMP domain-containing sensor histidine kinase [Rhizobium]AJD45721.1 sensor histidine kinase protein [Rhizobium gallicum bv. gallicum R602sp]NNH33586.1 HAMP domain-containing histidine kinase [Rhizobium sp. SEMIA 4085]